MTAEASDGLPPLRQVINACGLRARKSLGQNFLLDLNLTRRIARSAGPLEGYTVLEVGPGPGGLTRALFMEGASKVVCIERDSRCLPALEDISETYPHRLKIVEDDALTVELRDLDLAGPIKIVANLPYNIATPLLIGWLKTDWPPIYSSMTLMFQKEVAERLTARPGSKAYGRLSIMAQWRCEVARQFDVAPKAFLPVPKVTSSIVQFVPLLTGDRDCDVLDLERVTAAAFGQRRKMLRSSLKSLPVCTETLLAAAGLAPTTRPEDVDVDGFCRLADEFATLRNKPGVATTVENQRN